MQWSSGQVKVRLSLACKNINRKTCPIGLAKVMRSYSTRLLAPVTLEIKDVPQDSTQGGNPSLTDPFPDL